MSRAIFYTTIAVVIAAVAGCDPASHAIDEQHPGVEREPNDHALATSFDEGDPGLNVHDDPLDSPIVSVSPAEAPQTVVEHDPSADERARPRRRRMSHAEVVASESRWVHASLDKSPARITIAKGPIHWRFVRDRRSPTGAWLMATVETERACRAPQQLTVAVPYHSEVGDLQPAPNRPLLMFGTLEGGTLRANWAAPYGGHTLHAHRVDIPLTPETLFADCN